MPKAYDFTEADIGAWHVLRKSERKGTGTYWICKCACGRICEVRGTALAQRHSTECKSCAQSTHNLSKHPFFATWVHIMQRCHNPKNDRYEAYGGRGIIVCAEWHAPAVFLAWMESQTFPDCAWSLDREDNDGPYAPWNCRIATAQMQSLNKRNTVKVEYNGETLLLRDFILKYSKARSYRAAEARYYRGKTLEEVIAPSKC